MSKRATVVVDLQNDYLGSGRMPLQGIDAAVANAGRVIAAARERGEPVIHVRHEFTSPDAPFFVAGSEGSRIVPALTPAEGETTLTKHHPNSFHDGALDAHLKSIGVNDVVIVGAMSHMCIDATTRAAADSGYNVTVIHDACAAPNVEFGGVSVPGEQVHAAMMAALAFAYAKVISANEHIG